MFFFLFSSHSDVSKMPEIPINWYSFPSNGSVWDEKSFLSMTWEQRAWDYNRETRLKTSKRQPWIESDNGRIPELLLYKDKYMCKVCSLSKLHIVMNFTAERCFQPCHCIMTLGPDGNPWISYFLNLLIIIHS